MKTRFYYLLDKYLDNSISRQELDELFEFIGNPELTPAVKEWMRSVYDEIRQQGNSPFYVDKDGKLLTDWCEESVVEKKEPILEKRSVKPIVWMAAATLIFIVAFSLFILNKNNQISNLRPIALNTNHLPIQLQFKRKSTEKKQQKYILLSDSTQVWINSASSLDYPDKFSGKGREVCLSGEAFFEVRHAREIPFVVHLDSDINVYVLGTAFNVKAYPTQNEITISVAKGMVKVVRKNKKIDYLTKGQELKINKSEATLPFVINKKLIAPSNAGSWHSAQLIYDDESLNDVISDLNAFYGSDIRLENLADGSVHINTAFNRDINVDDAVRILCILMNKKMVKEKEIIWIK